LISTSFGIREQANDNYCRMELASFFFVPFVTFCQVFPSLRNVRASFRFRVSLQRRVGGTGVAAFAGT